VTGYIEMYKDILKSLKSIPTDSQCPEGQLSSAFKGPYSGDDAVRCVTVSALNVKSILVIHTVIQ